MDYLAITELRQSESDIHFLFNFDIGYLPKVEDIPWAGDISVTLTSASRILKDITKICRSVNYSTASSTSNFSYLFKSRLKKPIIKLDEEAEEYLKQFDIINQGLNSVTNIYDKIGRNTKIYEYF
ncbi:hypothetical protein CV093_05945 [Oceanobacillus sp. 143]|nr:hypothetical protein CV093_05945 [Oceanobacillus sp. 143]